MSTNSSPARGVTEIIPNLTLDSGQAASEIQKEIKNGAKGLVVDGLGLLVSTIFGPFTFAFKAITNAKRYGLGGGYLDSFDKGLDEFATTISTYMEGLFSDFRRSDIATQLGIAGKDMPNVPESPGSKAKAEAAATKAKPNTTQVAGGSDENKGPGPIPSKQNGQGAGVAPKA